MKPAVALIAAAAALAGGCATTAPGTSPDAAPDAAPARAASPADPWENWNRKVFSFNETVDEAVVRPAAEAYRDVLPQIVRTGIGNVLANIRDVWSAANQFLQGKPANGVEMSARVLVNTTMGLFGLLDWGTELKLERRSEDFGQTLGVWGVGSGPYVVLPFLGPSSVRDGLSWPVDRQFAPARLPQTDAGSYSVLALELLDTRADLLETTSLVDQVALDRYTFVRDAWLARRLDQVHDGAPPVEDIYGDPDAEPAK